MTIHVPILLLLAGCAGPEAETDPPADLDLALVLPDPLFGATIAELAIHVTRADTPAAGVSVDIDATGGAVTDGGVTNAEGTLLVDVAIAPLEDFETGQAPTRFSAHVTATDDEGATAEHDVEAPIWDHGVLASYSNGSEIREGPILHGHWQDCPDTAHQIYQAECTTEAPVAWPWGQDFTATWSGMLYTDDGGELEFYAWVDGIVSITIDGQSVADLQTHGEVYSSMVDLPPDAWVPLEMSFAPWTGSNNMELSWGTGGMDGRRGAVPRAHLATPRD